jgi:hypothetical protein
LTNYGAGIRRISSPEGLMLQDQLERENIRLKTENDALSRVIQLSENKARVLEESMNRTIARYRSLLILSLAIVVVLSLLLTARF